MTPGAQTEVIASTTTIPMLSKNSHSTAVPDLDIGAFVAASGACRRADDPPKAVS